MWARRGFVTQILANGIDVVFDRVNETAIAMEGLSVADERYAPLVAKMNILGRFEPIEPTRSVLFKS